MTFLFNDLALAGQYAEATAFHRELDELLAVRARVPHLRGSLLCSRSISERPVTATQTFREAVQASADRDFVRRVLGWIASTGPFWDDERQDNPDDFFHFAGTDVTEQGLGEAARRRLVGREAVSLGPLASPRACGADRLDVLHGLTEAPLGTVPVPNLVGAAALLAHAEREQGPPANWTEMLVRFVAAFPTLELGRDLARFLRPHPFSAHVAERASELLGLLHAYVSSRDATGTHTERTNEIVATFFSGDRARFTDESRTNKNDFRRELTFDDPSSPGERLFCPFHGKINTPPYRIHFVWPLQATESRIKVVYIGPKITR